MNFLLDNKPLTVEDHVLIGQAIKDVDNALVRLSRLINTYVCFSVKGKDKVRNLANYSPLDSLRSQLEDKMFKEHPELSDKYLDVYYHNDIKFEIPEEDQGKYRKVWSN